MDPVYEDIIMFPILFLLIVWITWLMFKKWRIERELQMHALDLQREMVRKFDSSQALQDFLKTDEGKRCFPIDPEWLVRRALIRTLSLGITLILFAVAMWIQSEFWKNFTDSNDLNKAQDYFYWGCLAAAAGAGLILNSALNRAASKRKNPAIA